MDAVNKKHFSFLCLLFSPSHVSGCFTGFVLPAQQRQNAQRHQGEFEEMFILMSAPLLSCTTSVCTCGEIKSKDDTKGILDFELQASLIRTSGICCSAEQSARMLQLISCRGVDHAVFVFPQGANILLTDNGYIKLGERSRQDLTHSASPGQKNAALSPGARVFSYVIFLVFFSSAFPATITLSPRISLLRSRFDASFLFPHSLIFVSVADFGVSAQITATLAKRKSFIGTPYWLVLFI